MKQGETVRANGGPVAKQSAKPVGSGLSKATPPKPVGPMTYQVSKGSDVFWSAKASRK